MGFVFGCPSVDPSVGRGNARGAGLVERWESVAWSTRAPGGDETFKADAGNWYLGDTASNFDCGPTPHTAEIITHRGSQAIRLNSNESPCNDNVWIQIVNEPSWNNALEIPISPSTRLSFFAEGHLEESTSPSPCGLHPCEITLEVEDTRGSLLVYILQPTGGRQREGEFYSVEIPLDSDDGHYERNLYEDFRQIPWFDPNGAHIRAVSLSIDNHGWVIMDDLVITQTDRFSS
jgi:hypothetical protein